MPGIVVTESGNVITCHPGDPVVMTFDGDGNLLSSWQGDFADAHGITLVNEGGVEFLWIADNGSKRSHRSRLRVSSGRIACARQGLQDHAGRRDGHDAGDASASGLRRHALLPHDSRGKRGALRGQWRRLGGRWVWRQLRPQVHPSDGEYVGSINGEEGAGAYNCPHGIFIDRRKSEPELYVADRANARVQVYDMEGGFKRSFGSRFPDDAKRLRDARRPDGDRRAARAAGRHRS